MSPFQRAVTNEGSGTPLQGVVAKYPFQRVHYAEATDLTGATHNLRGHVILILLILLVTYYIRVHVTKNDYCHDVTKNDYNQATSIPIPRFLRGTRSGRQSVRMHLSVLSVCQNE